MSREEKKREEKRKDEDTREEKRRTEKRKTSREEKRRDEKICEDQKTRKENHFLFAEGRAVSRKPPEIGVFSKAKIALSPGRGAQKGQKGRPQTRGKPTCCTRHTVLRIQ